jgi:ferredoxin-NADP reductase
VADKKTGRVIAINQVQEHTRLITLQLESPPSIAFAGGQYVIVHSGVELEPGKVAKGTFTIVSPETQTDRITLAVRQIGDGPCTTWLNRTLRVGDELGYSGPWGAKNYETPVGDVEALFVATDTGINAVLAFLNSCNAAACLSRARVVWLLPSDDYFLPIDYVKNALPAAVHERFQVEFIAPPGTSLRVEQAVAIVEEQLKSFEPRYSLLSGDGDILAAVRDLLMERGLGANVTLETYFNKLDKDADVKKNFGPATRREPARPQPLKPQRGSW